MQPTSAERAILVGLDLKGRPSQRPGAARLEPSGVTAEESLEELATLASGAGAVVVDQSVQSRPQVDASTLVGSGKVDELSRTAKALEADVVIFDRELSPTQLRNLERALDTKVIDRTQLILDIFARRARTREGQLQVELAQLEYALPRLTGKGIAMSRLGGGIGTRGPGETKLESDRRRIARRMQKIKKDLETVRSSRGIQRRERQAVPLATVALVGYTNAGKSTLFNRLTGAGVLADPRLFATLDPTVRHLTLPSNRRILLSDTVGFIRHLPTTLVNAFRATLEEVVQAELLLHVVDVSSEHSPQNAVQVGRVLAEIGAEATPQILVLNKIDRLPESEALAPAEAARLVLPEFSGPAVAVSAASGEGVPGLLAAIDEALRLDPVLPATFRLPAGGGRELGLLHDRGRVLETRYLEDSVEVEAEVPESLARRLAQYRLRPATSS